MRDSCLCTRVFDWLALLFPWQARARQVAAEVKACPKRAARSALPRLPTAPARAATARAHVARAFLRASVHCWAALFVVSRRASDSLICFEIWDYFIKFDFFYFPYFRGFISVVFLFGSTACRAGLCTSARAAGARGGGGCQRRRAGPVPAPSVCACACTRAGVGSHERVCAAMIIPAKLMRTHAHTHERALTPTRAHR